MKVNMTPNPLDVVTIHASQGDTEAREWEFELHNNGELIDTSEVSEQMFFKAYKGGTEQILPENGSVPTTAPFLGDIKYPQGILSDQEFLYRESPTEEDGNAKITSIKGNTLVWNQLVQNGNFADSSNWTAEGSATINSITNNTINVTTASLGNSGIAQIAFPMISGHKYLLVATIKTTGQTNISISGLGSILFNTNSFVTKGGIFIWTAGTGSQWSVRIRNFDANSATFEARNVMLFDLTQMGLDITEPSEFTSLFPLSYYSYNQGSLLSFNGNGIKTVGKNLLDKTKSETGGIDASGNLIAGYNLWRTTEFIPVEEGQVYSFTSFGVFYFIRIYYYDNAFNFISPRLQSSFKGSLTFTVPNGIKYIKWSLYNDTNEITQEIVNASRLQISKATSVTQYEPYISHTTNLPISTYFPTGMKSAGTVYDELTPRKAITRVGAVDLGTLNWTYNANYGMYTGGLIGVIKKPSTAQTKANVLCANRTIATWSQVFNSGKESGLCGVADTGHFGYSTTETDPSTFKQSMSGVYLYYELATPTETSFTTASLVTENAEIPLSNNDGTLIGKCTEQLSENPGFIDAKIKLSDADGECYSNKIQLHVERSPQ